MQKVLNNIEQQKKKSPKSTRRPTNLHAKNQTNKKIKLPFMIINSKKALFAFNLQEKKSLILSKT